MKLNKQQILNKIKKFDTVTFDIFDTLITRCVCSPDDVIKLVSFSAAEKFARSDKLEFYSLWKKSTKNLRNKTKKTDYSLKQIFQEIEKFNVYTKSQLSLLINTLYETELKYCIPRRDMLDLYNQILKLGKKIIIVSDMHFSPEFLSKILHKCGYKSFDKIIVSNVYSKNKLSGELWKHIFKSNDFGNSIHIGDNRKGDYRQVKKLKHEAIRIPSSSKEAKQNKFLFNSNELSESVSFGLIINNILFNSPFRSSNIFDSYFKLGYSLYGPIILNFFNWIVNQKQPKKLLFLSREGYFLQQIFNHYQKYLNSNKKIGNDYIYVSRQASLICNIDNENNLKDVCKFLKFKGSVYNFLKNRFDIETTSNLKKVFLNNKSSKVIKIVEPYKEQIIKNSKANKRNYVKYLNSKIVEDTWFVDIGYRGTIQKQISKMIDKKIAGKYLLLVSKSKDMSDNFPFKMKKNYIGLFTDLFETLLRAPEGQFIKMMPNNKPIFNNEVMNQKDYIIRSKVIEGIKKFISDISEYSPENISLTKIDNKLVYKNLINFWKQAKKGNIDPKIAQLYVYNDPFSNLYNKLIFKSKH